MSRSCPVCASGSLERVLDLPDVPVLSTAFHPDQASARAAPRGDLHLAVCRSCALVWNVAFDARLVDYDAEYENSQHFSPAFRAFSKELTQRLADTYQLTDGEVVEIGSGKGEFLSELCATAGCRGVGFDPSFDGEVHESIDGVRIVRGYYDRAAASAIDARLVLARHVLEHLADPVRFLGEVRVASGVGTPVYIEVPNAEYVFSDQGMWDLIYQHVGYFSQPTLRIALERAGFRTTVLGTAFHDQFLSVEGHAGTAPANPEYDVEAIERSCASIDTFAQRLRARLDGWRDRIATTDWGEVVLWGAGAKGVAFLNLLGEPSAIDRVVDLNPRKTGRFVPGTGHRIDAPDTLAGQPVSTVLVMNSIYLDEIRQTLRRLGSRATVQTV